MMGKDKIRPFSLRLDDDVRVALEEIAKKNNRSLNAEIEARLINSLNKEQTKGELVNSDPYQQITILTSQVKMLMDLIDTTSLKAKLEHSVATGKVKIKESK